jgi:ketosteroid isomerase-like protein
MLAPLPTFAGDADEIRAVFEADLDAWVAGNAEKASEAWHDQIVWFPGASAVACDSKSACLAAAKTAMAQVKLLGYTAINVQYRVIGPVGVQWGLLAATNAPQDGPVEVAVERFAATYVKADGKWKMVSWSSAPVASPN